MNNSQTPIREHGFEAQFKCSCSTIHHSKNTKYNTSPVDHLFIGQLYVDRFGREREETHVLTDSEWVLTFIDIWDTVALKAYTLDVIKKLILCQQSLGSLTTARELGIGVPGVTYTISRHIPFGGKDIGTQQIDNLICQGFRATFTGYDNGYEKSPGGEIECWYSTKLIYLVSMKASFESSESIYQLSNIRLVEPGQELFIVPTEYKELGR